MAHKRKRDELDSDWDDMTPGKQILPVASLPDDFDQEPRDGMQYLFLVRRDARRLPRITRARNPYEVSEATVVRTPTPLAAGDLPCEKWRTAFQAHFSNLRKNLAQTTHGDHDHSGSRRRTIPEKKDRDAWWRFLAGHPESVWGLEDRSTRQKLGMSRRMRAFAHSAEAVFASGATNPPGMPSKDDPSCLPTPCSTDSSENAPGLPDHSQGAQSTDATLFVASLLPEEGAEQLSPPKVTPGHLREIDHRMSIHLLMYFTHWINVHLRNPGDPLTSISVGHGQWIFALLTKVEDRLSADEMNLLRNLARACLGLVRMHRGEHVANKSVSEGAIPARHTTHMSSASCWIVYAAIAGYWGQRDLWADAIVSAGSPEPGGIH